MGTSEGELVGILVGAASVRELADTACFSVAQTYRVFERLGVARPMAARRRLRLERAAYELTRTDLSATEIGIDAGFGSLEGFSRAFRSAYGFPPSVYRRLAPTDYRLGDGGLHFVPHVSSMNRRQGAITMTLLDLIFDDHRTSVLGLLEKLEAQPSSIWDEVVPNSNAFPWMKDDETVRELASRNCGFGSPWIHLLDGKPRATDDGTLPSLRAKLENNHGRFKQLVQRFEKEGSWDLTFVDGECDPPEVFSYGSVVLMEIVYCSHARVCLEQHLRKSGVPVGFGTS